MKRIFAAILDILFYFSLLGVISIVGLIIIYRQENDISLINTYLQTSLVPTLLLVYGIVTVAYLIYFWILPTIFSQTLGQRLFGTSFTSTGKIGLWRVFLKTIIGRFWDIVLFPYTLVMIIKKKSVISSKLSGITIAKIEKKPTALLSIFTLVYVVFMVVVLGTGTYVYRTGITPIMERYTNYQHQVEELITKLAFQDATPILEKYKQYNGDNADYAYYHCIISANLSTEQSSLDICKIALEKNSGSKEKTQEILNQQAKLFAANDSYKEAATIYEKLWKEYNVRTLDMKNYVVVLSELGKSKEATEVLAELAKQIPAEDAVGQRDIGNLYERIGNVDLALEKYNAALKVVSNDSNLSLAGELSYDIGVIEYNKGKYPEAQKSFENAKEWNKDFAEPVESYIILISKLKNSVTK